MSSVMAGRPIWKATIPIRALLGKVLGLLDVSVCRRATGSDQLSAASGTERASRTTNSPTTHPGPRARTSLKFGLDITTTEDYAALSAPNLNGSYTYQTVNQFALDYSGNTSGAKSWQSFTQTLGTGTADMRINNYSLYIQDQLALNPQAYRQRGRALRI